MKPQYHSCQSLTPFDLLCSTSLFVACCEALLGRKLQGVRRKPTTAEERTDNVQAVLWELSHNVLQTDLSHISSQGVVSQDPVDVYNLLEIMSALMTQDNQPVRIGDLTSRQCPSRACQAEPAFVYEHATLADRGILLTRFALSDDNDQIPAVHQSLNSPGHMQQEGKTAEPGRSDPAQLTPSSKLRSCSSNLCSNCCFEVPMEEPAPSPASVRPKQRAAPYAHQHAADDASSSSQCSQCLEQAHQRDEDHDKADQPQQQSRKMTKASRKAAGSELKVHAKRQAKKALLVMPKCYAAAVRPVLEQSDEQNIDEASDR